MMQSSETGEGSGSWLAWTRVGRAAASIHDAQVWGISWGKNKQYKKLSDLLDILAERTGLEPATPGVTGRYSNQLNYRSAAVKQLQLQ